MVTYAIGDVHGCRATLEALLAGLPFRPDRDRLWMVGDLVNRGPDSLGVLRWARRISEKLGERFVAVLGNHDLHLLGLAAGVVPAKRRDTLEPVLRAPDRDELLDWLAARPLLHRSGDTLVVHGGLPPSWDLDEAEELAREAEAALGSPARRRLLASFETPPDEWCEGLAPLARRAFVLAALTLIRMVGADGSPRLGFSGPPDQAPRGCVPWYAAPQRASAGATVVCGHWAALGLHLAPGVVALDSGCVWGGPLTAVRLEDGEVFQVENRDNLAPRRRR